jgi:ferric-dicitrate binding protein FerR (iron transport regulator)
MKKDKMEHIDWEKMAKLINGEASSEDKSEMEDWLSADEENRKLYNTLKRNWDKTGMMNKEQYDVDKAWNKLNMRINEGVQEQHGPISTDMGSGRRILQAPLFRVAAVIILLLGMAYLLTNRSSTGISFFAVGHTYESAPDSEQSLQLPDGSQVFMNASSRMDYREKKRTSTREVRLQGEAFFDVSPDSKRPFIVHAGPAVIRVVGTSFNIKTFSEDQRVEVSVESGRVELMGSGRQSSSIVLEPGYTGLLSEGSLSKIKTEDDNLLSWKTKDLVFRELNLNEVIEVLSSTFHRDIVLEQESIASFHFTGNFNDQPIDTVLKVLCTAFDLTYEDQGSSIILSLAE